MLIANLSLDTAILCAAVVWLLFALTFAALGTAEPRRRAVWFWSAAYAIGAVRHALSLPDVAAHYLSEAAVLFALVVTTLHAAGAAAAAGRKTPALLFLVAPGATAGIYLAGRMVETPSPVTAIPMVILVGGYLAAGCWWFAEKARAERSPACLLVSIAYGLWGILAAGFAFWARYAPDLLPPATVLNMLLGALTGILLIIISLLETVRQAGTLAAEAEQAKRRLEQLVASTSDWIWETDAQHRYTFFSSRVEDVTGASIPNLLGRRRDELPANDPDSPVWHDYRARIEARRPFRDFRYPALSGDGRRITLSVSGAPVFDPKGGFTGYRGTGRDVTEETVLRLVREALGATVGNQVGDAFFTALVGELGRVIGADLAFVARLGQDGTSARTLAVCHDGAAAENFVFPLAGSPCAEVVEGSAAIYSTGVQTLFPEDAGLRRLGIDAFAGIGLMGGGGRTLGILVLASRTRYRDDATIRAALELVAPRAAAELERSIALQALKDGEARFRVVIDNLPLSLTARDLEGRFIFANQTYEQIVGIGARDLLGRTLRELMPRFGDEALVSRIEASDRAVLASESIVTEEATRADARRNGMQITQFVTQFPIRDVTGRTVAVGSAAADISERKLMEDRLRVSEARFRAVVEHLPIAFELKDLSGRYLIANPAFASMIGLSPERIVGHTLEDLESVVAEPEFFRNTRLADERLLETGQAVIGEYVQPDPLGSGRMVVIAMTKFPVRGDDGEILAIGTALQDVTADWQLSRERSAREAEARAGEARFRAVIDNLPFGFDLRDPEGRYLIVNRSLEASAGMPAAEMLGRRPADIMPNSRYPDAHDGSDQRHRTVLEAGDARVFDLELPDPQDPARTIYVSITKFPVPAADGSVAGVGSLLVDMTQRRRMDETVRESEARLRSILDNMPFEFAARDRDGRFIIVNQSYADVIGLPAEEILGLTPDDLGQKLNLTSFFAGWRENDRRVVVENGSWTFEADYPEPRDPSRISPRLMSKFPIHDSGRRVIAVGTLAVDISERRRMERERDQREAEIRESEARMRSVINGMPYDFSARDRDGRFIFVGAKYAERLGLPAEDILGRTPDEVAARVGIPGLFIGWRENDAAVLNEGRLWSFEADYPMTTSGGRIDPYLISKFPIRDADGSIVAAATLGIDITERRRLERERDAREAALRQSEARFRAVVDNLPIGFQLKGRDHRYIMVNQALAALVGLSAEQMQGRTAAELRTAAGDAELFKSAEEDDREVLDTGRTVSREVEEPDPRDPSRRIFLSRVKFPLFDDSGQPAAIGTLVTDITNRHRMEEERAAREASIRESEARFRAVIDNMPIGLSIKTLEGRFVAVNGAHQAMMNIPASQSLGATAPELAAGRGMPGLYDRFVAADRAVLQSGGAEAFEVNLPHPDGPGGERFYLISKFPIPDQSGKTVGIGTMITDITGQRQLTETIAAREAELRRVLAALDMMREGITVEDSEGRALYANHAARDLLGRERGVRALLEDLERVNLPRKEGHWSGEFAMRHPLRGELEVRIDSVSLTDGTVVSIIEDVTEERARRRETDVLARRLQHSEKMEALGRFAGGIAHDFNNLLGAIVGFAGFIAEDSAPEDNNRIYAERILAAGNRAKNVIQEILGFSRTDEPVKEPVVMGDLVRETVDIVHSTLPGTTVIEVVAPEEPLVVPANADQLTRVLMNLIINASDALEGRAGTVHVTVGRVEIGAGAQSEPARSSPGLDVIELPQGGWRSVAGRVLPGPYVALDVVDRGQGMTRDVLEKIYDPFFTTKGRGKGTGLGLPLVHGIVLAHGGAIIVETTPGAGTLFRILLPTAIAPPRKPREEKPPAAVPAQGRILIVDDDQDFGDMVQTALDRAGYEAAVVNDPLEALEVVREDPSLWDLVVTDFNMPGLSGTDLIGALRHLRPNLPCVLCTGYGLDIDEQRAIALGARAFRRKPVDVAGLVADIGRMIGEGT